MKAIANAVGIFLLIALAYTPSTAEQTLIRVKGAHAVSPAVEAIGKAFMKEHPDCKVEVTATGTPKGFREFIDKRADVVLATRPLKPKEIKIAEKKDLKLVETRVGSDPYAVFTDLGNPINELSVEQVRKIFTGEYTSWSQIGGKEEPIVIFALNPQVHGSAEYFRKWVFQGPGKFPSTTTIVARHGNAIMKVANTDGAIGFGPAIKAIQAADRVKVVALKIDSDSAAAFPSKKTVIDGSYPLVRPVLFYWDPTAKDPLLRKFVELCKKTGVTAVK